MVGYQNHHWETFDILLRKIDDELNNKSFLQSALHLSASNPLGAWPTRQILDFRVVDANYADSLSRTALLWAARAGSRSEVVAALISSSSDNTRSDEALVNAWQVAAFRGHSIRELCDYATGKLQIKQPSIIDGREYSQAVLRQAIRGGHSSFIKTFLPRSALTTIDLNEALFFGAVLGHTDVIEVLLANGAEIEARNEYGQTALHLACQDNHSTVVSMLLKKGADPNTIASEGWYEVYGGLGETALYSAYPHGEIMQELVSHGANPNVQCRDGQTALFRAVAEGKTNIVKMLLNAGADATIPDAYGVTPVEIAQSNEVNVQTTFLMESLVGQFPNAPHTNKKTHPISSCKEAVDATTKLSPMTWLKKTGRSPHALVELLGDTKGIINSETLGNFLELDEDETPMYNFSRGIMRSCFHVTRKEWPKVHDALLCADFPEIHLHIGEYIKSCCKTIGLYHVNDICEEIQSLCRNRELWIGRVEREEDFALSDDVAAAAETVTVTGEIVDYGALTDAQALRKIKVHCQNLLKEVDEAEALLIAFYKKIQDPDLVEELLGQSSDVLPASEEGSNTDAELATEQGVENAKLRTSAEFQH